MQGDALRHCKLHTGFMYKWYVIRATAMLMCSKTGKVTNRSLPFLMALFRCQSAGWSSAPMHGNERCRRLVMHHDRKCSISAAWVWLAEAPILASRLTALS